MRLNFFSFFLSRPGPELATPAVSGMTGRGTCGRLGPTSTERVEVGTRGSGVNFLSELVGQADA